MSEPAKKIGLIIGQEWEWPEAFMQVINDSGSNITAELVELGGTFMEDPREYDVIVDRTRLDNARPANHLRHSEAPLKGRALLSVERADAAVRPTELLRTVVRAINNDGVVGNAELVQLVEEQSDRIVMFDHTVGIKPNSRSPLCFLFQSRPDVHSRGAHPAKEWVHPAPKHELAGHAAVPHLRVRLICVP